ncbi:MAG: diguanylate cyclase [Planctomycetota bacterium]
MTTKQSKRALEDKSGWYAGFKSLQFKASFLVLVLILAVTISGMVLCMRTMSTALYENQESQSQEWATALASYASEAYTTGDMQSLNNTCQELIQTLDVAYVTFTDLADNILASAEIYPGLTKISKSGPTKLTHDNPYPPSRILKRGTLDQTYLDIVVPVYKHGQAPATSKISPPVLGYLRFGTDLSGTLNQLTTLKNQIIQTTIVILLVAIPCCLLVTRHVVAPLQVLARTARAIANGSMNARANVHRRNEIGELADSFNTMASRVAISQKELLELNSELERRVQQRTQELEELAARDPLTGLYNRRHFGEEITREFAASERYDADMSCLMFDLDCFKEANDKFGHRTGDEILIQLAKAISTELRESDVAARFGGDEFILLLPQTSAPAAYTLADRVVKRFDNNLKEMIQDADTTLSVGIASLRTSRAKSAEALINNADMAMYAAKENGRNCIIDATMVPVHH